MASTSDEWELAMTRGSRATVVYTRARALPVDTLRSTLVQQLHDDRSADGPLSFMSVISCVNILFFRV